MNRRSLSTRLSKRLGVARAFERPDYFRVHLEPLEKRQLLAGNTYYVNDTWTDGNGGTLNFGDSVSASLTSDPNSFGISGTYGIDCFGKSSSGSFASGYEHIADAIAGAGAADTVSLIEGTYTESDIVINKAILFSGTGTSGSANTLIVPETTSAQTGAALANFGVGTHSGIFILSDSVTVQQVHLNGNGNPSLGGSLNYHQGITHLYDTQNGGAYSSIRNGSVTPIQIGNAPDAGRPNRSIALCLVQNVVVENTFWHGITFSALSGKQFGMSGSAAQNQVINSTVNNVGPAGSKDYDRVGILVMNVDNYPNEDPGLGAVPAGSVLNCTINNAGVGAALRTFGAYDQNNGARNQGAINYTTVNNAATIGIEYSNNDGGVGKVNTISLASGSTAIGMQISNSSTGRYSNNTISNALIGVKILDSRYSGGLGFPVLGLNTITGPGTGVGGSIGVLATNSASAPEASLALSFGGTISGFQTGVKVEQPFATTTQSILALDNPNVTGNGTGFNISGNYHVEGHAAGGASITGSGIEIKPGNDLHPFQDYNSITNETVSPAGNPATADATPPAPTGAVAMPNTVDAINTGNFTLDPTSSLKIDINGAQAYKDVQNFNGGTFVYTLTTETNPWRSGFVSPGALGLWLGNTTQSGGSLQVNSTTTELGAVFDLGDTSNPVDMRGMQMVQVVAKKVAGANPDNFAVVVGDIDGTSHAYLLPTSGLNTSTYTTLQINVLSTLVKVQDCLTGLNMSAISAWAVVSDLGDSNMNASDNFGLNVDSIGMVSPLANSIVNVVGSVTLNGATLKAALSNPSFTPTIGQTFKIIDNDGTDAVSGTFAGLAEGATTVLNGGSYKVSYIGGSGNDVTLERIAAANSSVLKTNLFYKGSTKWDVTNGATFSDDNAIAPDKTAYLPGSGTSSFAAVSSYDKGINGIMVDLSGPHGSITANDFTFKRGNNNSPNAWTAAIAPTAVTTRAGAGQSASDRIELLWADNDAVKKQWLEVIVEGNDTVGGFNTNTGLAQSYVFYFGNPLGDSGTGNAGAFQVTSSDEVNARNNPKTFTATRSDVNDFNRDGSVNSTDQIIARNNGTNLGNQLKFLVVGAGGPFAPESSGGASGDSGVASGLAASSPSSSSSSASSPAWLGIRLESLSQQIASGSSLLDDDGDESDLGGDGDDDLDSTLDLLTADESA
jgi:hypothetical protein